ncbi:MAG: hypothetical protein AAB834_07655, partial [Patescibacteria group bacterium]
MARPVCVPVPSGSASVFTFRKPACRQAAGRDGASRGRTADHGGGGGDGRDGGLRARERLAMEHARAVVLGSVVIAGVERHHGRLEGIHAVSQPQQQVTHLVIRLVVLGQRAGVGREERA